MKILIVRHGDPDYEHDSLTERGRKEAVALAGRLSKLNPKAIYVSPLGRALETCSYTLKKIGMEATVLPWLQEFPGRCLRPDCNGQENICWDFLPQDWSYDKAYYDKDEFSTYGVLANTNVKTEYDKVVEGFDNLLKEHGYEREKSWYRVLNPNEDTIILFCHLGVESVILSRIMNISPMPVWHNMASLTSSVTTVVSEERREGIAQFRIIGFSDVSHLIMNNIEPSESARFCECFYQSEKRHD